MSGSGMNAADRSATGMKRVADWTPVVRGNGRAVCVNVPKERPRCRVVIIERGLRPLYEKCSTHAECKTCGTQGKCEEWNGYFAVRPDGTHVFLSDGMRKQMKRMILEGTFGNYGESFSAPATSPIGAVGANGVSGEGC